MMKRDLPAMVPLNPICRREEKSSGWGWMNSVRISGRVKEKT
jgi:hypothetical protein